MKRALLLVWVVLAMLMPAWVFAADSRYEVEVQPDMRHGETVASLHANIAAAIDRALPRLWRQLLSPGAAGTIPGDVRGIQFLQQADPTNDGVRIVFDQQRVLQFLKSRGLNQAYAEALGQAPAVSSSPGAGLHGQTLILTIDRPATLSQQVLFEHDLRSQPEVAGLYPALLNRNERRYRIMLSSLNDAWLPVWLERHGYHAVSAMDGWSAR